LKKIGLGELDKIRWRFYTVEPRRVIFPSDRNPTTIGIYQHDVIDIHLFDQSRYILDLTGEQLGIDSWLFTYEDYQKNYVRPATAVHTSFNITVMRNEAKAKADLEAQDHRIKVLKEAVLNAVTASETQWGTRNLRWSDLLDLGTGERQTLLKEMANEVQQAVVARLSAEG
jgi:hypothetical protein